MGLGQISAAVHGVDVAAQAIRSGADDAARTATTHLTASELKLVDGVVTARGQPVGASHTVIGWGVPSHKLKLIDSAGKQGATVFNSPDAIVAAHRKHDVVKVLQRAGIPTVEGITVRTPEHLDAAVQQVGFPIHIRGGYPFSQLAPSKGAHRAPSSTLAYTANDIRAFAEQSMDRQRLYTVSRHVPGQRIHAVVAGDSIVKVTHKGTPETLSQEESRWAIRSIQALGLDTGGVDIIRTPEGKSLVRDVHPTPRLTKQERADLISSPHFRDALDQPLTYSESLISAMERQKVTVGIFNSGTKPGKNIARTMAEFERQGARPVFVSINNVQMTPAGMLKVGDKELPHFDAFLTRTGAVIDDKGLAVLREVEQSGALIFNRADAVSKVRSKVMQAEVMEAAGVAHPRTRTIMSPADIDPALDVVGAPTVLKNPSSSEGRGVMFLPDRKQAKDVAGLVLQKTESSLLAAKSERLQLPLQSREDAVSAIHQLSSLLPSTDARGNTVVSLSTPIAVVDATTGASALLTEPAGVLSVTSAFADAKVGSILKAEPWYREAAGRDTRVHVMREDVRYRVIASMHRNARPNVYGEPRSNLSLDGYAEPAVLNAQQEDLAIRSVAAFDLDIGAADLIETTASPLTLEVNLSPGLDIEATTGPVADHWVSMILNTIKSKAHSTHGVGG